MKFNKVGMFLFILLIGLTVVSAADVTSDDATPTDIQDVVEETNIQKEVNVDNALTKETKTVKQDKVISESVTIDENNVNEYTNQNWTVSDGVTITGTNGVTLNDVSITVGDNVQLKDLTITTTNSNTLINAVGKSNLIIEDGTFTMTNTNYDNRRTISVNDKTFKADDVIVITSANMATYGYDRMVLYQLSKAAANGKTVIFSQDFPRNIIYVFGDYVNCTVKEIPLNTMTFGYNGGTYTIDGLYAPNTNIHIQNQASGTITNSVIKTLNLDGVGNTIISNNTIITNNIYNISSENAIITDNYVIGYDSNNVITGNNRFTTEGTVENNNPISGDYVLNETNYNTLFNEDNTLKDTVSGTIIVVGNITTPVIITNPVNIITAPSPGKYTYYDGTTVDIEYGLSDVTFAQGSSNSNIIGAQIGNIKINDNGITVSNSNITGKITVSASGAVIKDNNIVGENSLVELVNAETATIINNNIETNNTYAVTVDADSIENTIKDNTLIAGQLKGNNAIENNADDTVIENNGSLPDHELIIDTTEFTEGQTATITATIYRGQDVQTGINKGKVVFKVNGKTLKDTNGKVIYATVVNGTATIADYLVPNSWNENTTIQAVYSGSTQSESLKSDKETITITKQAPAVTLTDILASKGESIQINIQVTQGQTPINTGKIVVKINGKTLKDTNGKIIYATVNNGIATINYTIPSNMKVNNYNLTVVFISSDYERVENTVKLTIE